MPEFGRVGIEEDVRLASLFLPSESPDKMSQSQKRKSVGGSDEMTGREKKKVRIAEARTIPVQSVASGSSSQVAGPSRVVPMNSECELGQLGRV